MGIKKKLWVFYILFILVFAAGQFLWAQTYPIDKGSKLFLGGMTIQTTSGKLYEDAYKNGVFNLTMNPAFAYFVLPGLATGMKLELSSQFQGNDKSYGFGVGPHISYAYGPHGEGKVAKFYPFVEANLLYVEKTERIGFDSFLSSSTLKGYKLNFGVGLDYMLTESVGVFVEGLYDMEKVTHQSSDEDFTGNAIKAMIGIVAFIY